MAFSRLSYIALELSLVITVVWLHLFRIRPFRPISKKGLKATTSNISRLTEVNELKLDLNKVQRV